MHCSKWGALKEVSPADQSRLAHQLQASMTAEDTRLKNSPITIAAQSNLSILRQTSKVSYCFAIGTDVN